MSAIMMLNQPGGSHHHRWPTRLTAAILLTTQIILILHFIDTLQNATASPLLGHNASANFLVHQNPPTQSRNHEEIGTVDRPRLLDVRELAKIGGQKLQTSPFADKGEAGGQRANVTFTSKHKHEPDVLIEGSGNGPQSSSSNPKLDKFDDTEDGSDDADEEEDDYDYKDGAPDSGHGKYSNRTTTSTSMLDKPKRGNNTTMTEKPADFDNSGDLYLPYRPPATSTIMTNSTANRKEPAIVPTTVPTPTTMTITTTTMQPTLPSRVPSQRPGGVLKPTTSLPLPIPVLNETLAANNKSIYSVPDIPRGWNETFKHHRTHHNASSTNPIRMNATKLGDSDYDYEDETDDEDNDYAANFEDNDPDDHHHHNKTSATYIRPLTTTQRPAGVPTTTTPSPIRALEQSNDKLNSSTSTFMSPAEETLQTTTKLPKPPKPTAVQTIQSPKPTNKPADGDYPNGNKPEEDPDDKDDEDIEEEIEDDNEEEDDDIDKDDINHPKSTTSTEAIRPSTPVPTVKLTTTTTTTTPRPTKVAAKDDEEDEDDDEDEHDDGIGPDSLTITTTMQSIKTATAITTTVAPPVPMVTQFNNKLDTLVDTTTVAPKLVYVPTITITTTTTTTTTSRPTTTMAPMTTTTTRAPTTTIRPMAWPTTTIRSEPVSFPSLFATLATTTTRPFYGDSRVPYYYPSSTSGPVQNYAEHPFWYTTPRPPPQAQPPIVRTSTVGRAYDANANLQLDEADLTKQIYDKAVEIYNTTHKAVESAIEALWHPNIEWDSATFEPLLTQPLLFMLALGAAVIGLVLTMMLVVYIITYQIRPRSVVDDSYDDISIY